MSTETILTETVNAACASILSDVLALRARCEQAEGELRQIDELMARRPALDEPTRYSNIATAIHTAKRCEQAERDKAQAERERDAQRRETNHLIEALHDTQPRYAKFEVRIAALEGHIRALCRDCEDCALRRRNDNCSPCRACRDSLALVPEPGGQ